MKRQRFIRPRLGNVVYVDEKVYKCVRSRFPAMCDGCAFWQKHADMATECSAPDNLRCSENVFIEIPENSVELLPANKKVSANPFLIIATAAFWGFIYFLSKIIFKQ